MTEIVYKDNYKESQKNLLREYARKPNWETILDILNEFTQELEGVFKDLRDKFKLNVAIGDQLDILGLIVGLRRFTIDDDLFRAEIKFKALENRSAGELEFLQDALAHLTNGTDVWILENYPAAMSGFVQCDFDDLPLNITAKMDRLSLGGVHYMYTNSAFRATPLTYAHPEVPVGGTYAWIDGSSTLITDGAGEYSWAY